MRLNHWPKLLLIAAFSLSAVAGALYWRGARLVKQSQIYEPLIAEAARRYRLDPHLIRAVIWRESAFQPDVFGAAQERGLMQVTPNAGKEWAKAEKITTFRETDLFDPRTNIMAGSWYLARAIGRWRDADLPEAFALAEYNAGRTHARRWAQPLPRWEAAPFIANIDYPTTKAYARDILEKRDNYKTSTRQLTPWRAVRNELAVHLWRLRQQSKKLLATRPDS
ncbi:MAG: lytic transglycosylase domain-containing protein [Verrucomicrobiales bacterium]|jgi:soluble lytic murein transglycosylase|nr:lytic transglycosylase domain-containing protein [Verrucomicrobiales bacterium]